LHNGRPARSCSNPIKFALFDVDLCGLACERVMAIERATVSSVKSLRTERLDDCERNPPRVD